jgi:hypothetical protein
MGMPMAGVAPGHMALTVTIGTSAISAGDHTIAITAIEFMEDHRRLPMSYRLLPLLEFLTRHLNPIMARP